MKQNMKNKKSEINKMTKAKLQLFGLSLGTSGTSGLFGDSP